MRVEEFDYDLPEDRIAQVPIEPRDAARLLVDRGGAAVEHRHVRDLADLLGPGDLLIVNETKVVPARLRLRRATGGTVEVLLLEPLDGERRRWEALVRPARKVRDGEVLVAADGTVVAVVVGRTDSGDTFEVVLDPGASTQTSTATDRDSDAFLERHGEMPLPPYITERLEDRDRYQTVYAREPGSAAAPTAGLHFTVELLDSLRDRGVRIEPVELVVGLDTFRPIGVEDPADHVMHTERYRVPESTMAACRDAGRVVAVGTTATRALESAAGRGELAGRTDLFIRRGYEWQVVDLMITNFHLPRTTLLLMIDAFVGPRWRRLYDEALASGYRFLSFGDAMLLDRSAG